MQPGTSPARLERDPRVRAVLAGLARGALGEGYEPDVPARMLDLIGRLASRGDRNQLLATLRLLDTKAGAFALTGRPVPVSWLSARESEALLTTWKTSRIPLQRRLGGIFLQLALSSLYSYPGPEWARIRYPGPLGAPPDTPKRLQPLAVEQDEEIGCDVVVVGSGAGGGCVAAALAKAGLDVVVLEKGGYSSESDFTHVEAEAYRDLYLYGLTLATTDSGCVIFSGATLGGGTVVNYTTSFRTPDRVREEWARVSGVDAFVSDEFDESLDEVSARLGVNTDSSAAGRRDELMEEGLKQLGWHVDNMPRAVRGCSQDAACGYCGMGCRIGAKQSSMRTYLEDAAAAGARIVVRADARRVTIEDGRATGVEATSGAHKLTVKARAVVVAGGSIETPALLLRSGLGGPVGHNLHLHPGTAAFGVFDDDVRVWEGTTQSRYSLEFADWDGGYGPIFETVPVHPGAGAPAIPWESAADHRARMGNYANLSFCAVLPRDETAGRVRITREGSPRIVYNLNREDQRRVTEAVIAAGKVMEAAGAREVYSPHARPISYVPGPGRHERWAQEVRRAGYAPGSATLFSFHQMGSCRMGTDPTTSVVGADNESHEVENLFVADASTFPNASGVNPMLTIYAIANRAGKKIAARLA